jgi:hypothetical protein
MYCMVTDVSIHTSKSLIGNFLNADPSFTINRQKRLPSCHTYLGFNVH